MLRHLPSDFGATDRVSTVAPVDGQLIHLVAIFAAAMRAQRVAVAIGLRRYPVVC